MNPKHDKLLHEKFYKYQRDYELFLANNKDLPERKEQYLKEQKHALEEAVRYVDRFTQNLHIATIEVRATKKGIDDAKKIHEEQIKVEQERLARFERVVIEHKTFIEKLKEFIEHGAPKALPAPKVEKKLILPPPPVPEPEIEEEEEEITEVSVCPHCSKAYKTPAALKGHITKAHPEV